MYRTMRCENMRPHGHPLGKPGRLVSTNRFKVRARFADSLYAAGDNENCYLLQ